MPKVKMTGQGGAVASLVEPGNYLGEITGYEFGFSSKGNEMLTLIIDVTKSKEGKGSRGRIYDRLVFSEAALWKVEQFIECFGASAGLSTGVGQEVDISEGTMPTFLNARGGVSVVTGSWDGKDRSEIDSFLPSKEVGVYPKGDMERVLTRQQRDAAGSSPASSPGAAMHVQDDPEDDIPF